MADDIHWADIYAERIIREKGDREFYVCASGITPSGTVHIGNLREIISVELVARALRAKGKKVRFIYSWDDFDVFRRVPTTISDASRFEQYLRLPITRVPDPAGKEESFARANERAVEAVLGVIGIHPEYIYQSEKYARSEYAEGMRRALKHAAVIREVLDEFRSEPLPAAWLPLSVFCGNCGKDTTVISSWDGSWAVEYSCQSCEHHESVDLRSTSIVKLPWRVDWPMRWAYEQVDFEPAGKEHHSAGGSFDTAKRIVQRVYGRKPPVTFKYDFVTIKGTGGKISSSKGNVVSVDQMLEVYQPEVLRFLFAGTRPDTEFSVSFDLDVLKIYEDYDRCERVYFGTEEIGEKRRLKERRIYELSQVENPPAALPPQVPFRHLCNILQIHGGDVESAVVQAAESAGEHSAGQLDPEALKRLTTRAHCAWRWIGTYAPEDFRFSLRKPGGQPLDVSDAERKALSSLFREVDERLSEYDEKGLAEFFYSVAEESGLESRELFRLVYRVLLGKEKGPRLAGFMLTVGRERLLPLLSPYASGRSS